MGGIILNLARKDSKNFITKGGFEEDILIVNPTGNISLETTGWATKHHLSFDTDGTTINAKNAHICLDEEILVNNNYPVRVDGEINLRNHRVSFRDSSGVIKKYIIKEHFPDETLGLIVCILGDFID